MNNEEKILALLEQQAKTLEQHSEMFAAINTRLDQMDSRLDRLEEKVDRLEEKVDRLEEYSEVTRDGVNALLDWAEACSETYRLPLPKVGQC